MVVNNDNSSCCCGNDNSGKYLLSIYYMTGICFSVPHLILPTALRDSILLLLHLTEEKTEA